MASPTVTPAPTFPTSLTGEIYISARTDGKPGTGTSSDPLNGSGSLGDGSRFTALLNAAAAYAHLHLSAGTYYFTDRGWQPKTGQVLQGAGEGVTRLVQANVGNFTTHGLYYINLSSNNEFYDFTIDFNYTRLMAGAHTHLHEPFGGLGLGGSHLREKNIEIVGYYGDTVDGVEEFSNLMTGTDNIAENVWTHNPAISHTNPICYTNGTMVMGPGSQIIDCTDDGSNHGFSACTGIIIDSTTTSNTNIGFYIDSPSFPIRDLYLLDDHFAGLNPVIANQAGVVSQNFNVVACDLDIYQTTVSNNAGICLYETGLGGKIWGNKPHYHGGNRSGSGILLNGRNLWKGLDLSGNFSDTGFWGPQGTTSDLINNNTILGLNYYRDNPTAPAYWHASVAGSPTYAMTTTSTATTTTLSRSAPVSFVKLAPAAGGAPYIWSLVLSDTGAATDDEIFVYVAWPGSANPTLKFYDHGTGGTLLDAVSGTAPAAGITYQFHFDGTHWEHIGENEIVLPTVAPSVSTGSPAAAAVSVYNPSAVPAASTSPTPISAPTSPVAPVSAPPTATSSKTSPHSTSSGYSNPWLNRH